MKAAPSPESSTVWLLTGPRPGEVAQQRALAEALALPVLEKRVYPAAAPASAARHGSPKRSFGWRPELAAELGLVPPWPAAVISFGQTLPAARWVQRASGGATRLIHLGRPRGVPLSDLDLIIPMPQDQLDEAGNVLRVRMPFNPPPARNPAAIAAAQARLAGLPRPWTVLLVGGTTRHFMADDGLLEGLARRACERVRQAGGSLLVSTSPRTPASWTAALRSAIDVPGEFYDFKPEDPANPLGAYLALADEFVLTGDTASMLAECWRTAKPIYLAPLRRKAGRRLALFLRKHLLPAFLVRALTRRGLLAPTVDLRGWLTRLEESGYVGILGRSSPSRRYRAAEDDDLRRAAERIKALLEAPAAPALVRR